MKALQALHHWSVLQGWILRHRVAFQLLFSCSYEWRGTWIKHGATLQERYSEVWITAFPGQGWKLQVRPKAVAFISQPPFCQLPVLRGHKMQKGDSGGEPHCWLPVEMGITHPCAPEAGCTDSCCPCVQWRSSQLRNLLKKDIFGPLFGV